VSEFLQRVRRLFDDGLFDRLRGIVEHRERLPGWEEEIGSDERLSLHAHVRAQLADDDEP
jgi:hypothetical protein